MKRTLSAAWSWKRLHDLPEGRPSVWSSSSSGGGGGGVSGDASKSSQGSAGGEPRLCESFSMFTHQFRSPSSANFNCAFGCRAGRLTPAPLPSRPLLCISHRCICHRSLTALYFPFQSISSHTHTPPPPSSSLAPFPRPSRIWNLSPFAYVSIASPQPSPPAKPGSQRCIHISAGPGLPGSSRQSH